MKKTSGEAEEIREMGQGRRELMDALPLSGCRLHLGSYTLDLSKKTALMGVLNITPDSFSDGGRFLNPEEAIVEGRRLIEAGADVLDMGGESSRPGSEPVSVEEELRRILPPLRSLVKMGIPISVDTYKAEVARAVLGEGASLINDISGLHFNPSVASVVARAGAGLVIMHMKGTPRNMQQDPQYDSLMEEVAGYFREGIARAESAGVRPDGILIDPGLGFGKNLEHNLTLLRRLEEFKCLGKPILLGPSRKSFIGLILDLPVEERLEGTAAVVAWGIIKGASMVRVHDVKEMKRVAGMIDALRDLR
jgi:dihydropteroate synthase